MQAEGRAPILKPAAKLLVVVAAGVVLVDQLTKALARSRLGESPIQLIPGLLKLELAENSGGAFGIFPWARWAFVVAATIAVIAIVLSLKRISRPLTGIAVGLLIGGAIGNVIDRLFAPAGRVTDFIYFRYWPTFNVADSAVFIGALLLAIVLWRSPERAADDPEPADAGAGESAQPR